MRRPDAFARLAVAVAVTLAAGVAAGSTGPARADTDDELAAAKRRLARLLDSIRANQETIARLQGEAEVLAGRVDAVGRRIAVAEARAERLRGRIARADRRIGRLQVRLDERARALYERGSGSVLGVLLGSEDFDSFSVRLDFIVSSERQDAELAGQVADRRAALLADRAEVRALEARLRADHRRLVREERSLRLKLGRAAAALATLHRDRERAEALVERLRKKKEREEARARLAAQLALSVAPPASSAGGPELFSVCPVDQPRAYVDDFGVVKPDGRVHQGNDVFAPEGTPVRAPFEGTAVDATNDLGGLSVKVLGAGGYVYNAHLSRIARLGPVSAGTVIGYVGTTGNALGTAPHNHLEWHPEGGVAVNPYPYLRLVC